MLQGLHGIMSEQDWPNNRLLLAVPAHDLHFDTFLGHCGLGIERCASNLNDALVWRLLHHLELEDLTV